MFFIKTAKKFLKPVRGEHQPDKVIIISLLFILLFGLVMLSSASSVVSYEQFGNIYHYFSKQFIWTIIGVIVFFLFSKIDYHFWKKWATGALIFSVILLVIVLLPGIGAKNGTFASSWINFFGISIQPSEFVKIAFLIYLATWLDSKKSELKRFSSGMAPFLSVLVIISVLMLMQPDFGTLAIIIAMAVSVFFVSGGNFKHIFMTGLLVVVIGTMYLTYHSGHEDDRFRCYKDPSYDPQGKCYQVDQSLIAVGSGGLFGRGLGQSLQKFMYLPEVWGDSIFPVMAEELGFIFSTIFLLIMLLIYYRCLIVAKQAPDTYGLAMAAGIVIWLTVQTLFNIGGMTNLIPMTGVPLPFISAGGSSALSTLIAMGIIVNISRQTKN